MSLMVVHPASLPSAALLRVGLFASKNVNDIFLTMAFFCRLPPSSILYCYWQIYWYQFTNTT